MLNGVWKSSMLPEISVFPERVHSLALAHNTQQGSVHIVLDYTHLTDSLWVDMRTRINSVDNAAAANGFAIRYAGCCEDQVKKLSLENIFTSTAITCITKSLKVTFLSQFCHEDISDISKQWRSWLFQEHFVNCFVLTRKDLAAVVHFNTRIFLVWRFDGFADNILLHFTVVTDCNLYPINHCCSFQYVGFSPVLYAFFGKTPLYFYKILVRKINCSRVCVLVAMFHLDEMTPAVEKLKILFHDTLYLKNEEKTRSRKYLVWNY